jgi:MFS family permease
MEFSELMKNSNFILIVASMTCTFSAYVAFLTNEDLLFITFGYSSEETSIFTIVLVISGLIGSFICARYLDGPDPKYKLLFNVSTAIGAVFCCLFLVTLPTSHISKAIFGVNLFLYGLFMIPTFTVIFPYVVELTYPSHEAVSTGLMLFSCRLFATAFGLIATLLS